MYLTLPTLFLSLEKTGGLFDIDATLPVLTIQFFLLVQLLSFFLFNPIQKLLKQREEEVEINLKNARLTLEQVEELQQKIRRILQAVRNRHSIRLKEIEAKRQTAVTRSKKYMETKVRNTRDVMVKNYINSASQTNDLIPGVVQEVNRYLQVRPPINRI